MQKIEAVHKQYRLYVDSVMPKREVKSAECSGKESVAGILNGYNKFVQLDKKARDDEIKQLRNQFDSMSSKNYDVMVWSRNVLRTAGNREKRIKDTI